MARALIVGCGCRGRLVGERLIEAGWAVRGTTRREEGLGEIAAAGIDPVIADPDRPGSLLDQVGDVAVVLLLLGSARGDEEALAAIHGPRLERLLEHLVDTPVRGVLYEANGSVDPALLGGGGEIVRSAGRTWRIPVAVADEGADDYLSWSRGIAEMALELLSPAGESK